MYRAHPSDTVVALRPSRNPLRLARLLLRGETAAISPMFALLLIPISGSIAYAVELGGWHYVQRAAQNAADSAAIAAASNNVAAGNAYLLEARAAANKLGFQNAGTTTVNVATVTCPTGSPAGATCYQATISTVFPRLFSRMVGLSGPSSTISAGAIASSGGGGGTSDVCMGALSSSGTAFQSNGGPRPDLSGCTIFSNSGMTCSGHDLGAAYGIAVGTNSGCGVSDPAGRRISGASPLSDPYSSRASNIPANNCPSLYPASTYPQLPTKGSDPDLPSRNLLSGTKTWTGNQVFCGDVQLNGNVTLTGSNTTIVIQNGRLDLHGYKISTASGAAATIVFSGDNSASYYHYPVDQNFPNGTKGSGPAMIDITAPSGTSDAWRGIAMYQNPALTTNVSFSEAGNDPAWNISGLAYFPKADVGFTGIVSKATNGTQCFVLLAYTITIGGTAQIFANTQCAALGLTPPSVTVGSSSREKLVS